MKFATVAKIEKTGSVFDITVADVLLDIENMKKYNRVLDDVRADLAIPSSFSSLIESSVAAGKPSFEVLSEANIAELASAIGCKSASDMKSMSLEAFVSKCDESAEASMEVAAEAIITGVIIAVWATYFTLMGIVIFAGVKGNCPDFKSIYRALETAFPGNKIKDALENITANTWTKKEYAEQITAIKAAMSIVKLDAKQIFEESYPLKRLEAAAGKLWVCPSGWAYDENGSSWSTWYENIPDRQRGKTLSELGFDTKSLPSICNDLSALCKDMITAAEIKKDLGKEHTKAMDKGSILSRIRAWWNDDKATKEEKARKRKVVTAKYDACRYLLRGISECTNGMCLDMITIAKKAETLAKKGPAPDAE